MHGKPGKVRQSERTAEAAPVTPADLANAVWPRPRSSRPAFPLRCPLMSPRPAEYALEKPAGDGRGV